MRAVAQRLRAPAASGWLTYVVAAAVSRVGAFLLVPLYTRRLSQNEYGAYALVVSLTALLPLIFGLGLTSIVSKAYFDAPTPELARARVGVVGRWLLASAGVSGGALAVAAALAWPEGVWGLDRPIVVLSVVGSLGAALAVVPEAYFRASRRARAVVALQLANFFGSSLLGVLFVAGLDRGLRGAVEAVAITNVALGLFALGFIVRGPGSLEPGFLRRWTPTSLPFVVHFIASWLLSMGDRWVLTAVGAEAQLGTYYLAVQIVSPAPILVSTWNERDAARLGEEYRDAGLGAARKGAPARAARYLGVALAGAAAVAVGTTLLPYLVGPKFQGATALIPALLVAHLAESQYFVPSNLLFFSGRTALIPAVTITAGVLNVSLAALWWERFGVAGLLAARITASSARSLLMAACAHRYAR